MFDAPEWPKPNPDGSYLITKEIGEKLSITLTQLTDYIETQYELCGLK